MLHYHYCWCHILGTTCSMILIINIYLCSHQIAGARVWRQHDDTGESWQSEEPSIKSDSSPHSHRTRSSPTNQEHNLRDPKIHPKNIHIKCTQNVVRTVKKKFVLGVKNRLTWSTHGKICLWLRKDIADKVNDSGKLMSIDSVQIRSSSVRIMVFFSFSVENGRTMAKTQL